MANNVEQGKQTSVFISEATVKHAQKIRAAQKYPPSLARLYGAALEIALANEAAELEKAAAK